MKTIGFIDAIFLLVKKQSVLLTKIMYFCCSNKTGQYGTEKKNVVDDP